jgi:serine/threonine protein kinase
MNVIHRDLKLPNILISNNILKIGDLGFAKRLESEHSLVKEALGTLGTMAPEIIEFKPYGLLADMFSLGAIFY